MKSCSIAALCFLLGFVVLPTILFAQEKSNYKLPDRIPYRKGAKWGYCDKDKKMVIPASFDKAGLFGMAPEHLKVVLPDSIAWVKKGGIEYWLTKRGKLTPVTAKRYPAVETEEGGTVVTAEMKYKFRDESGKYGLKMRNAEDRWETVLPPVYDEVIFDLYSESYTVALKKEGKWGIMRANTKTWLLSPVYDEINILLGVMGSKDESEVFSVTDNGLKGMFITDSLLVPVRYSTLEVIGKWRKMVMVAKDEKGVNLIDFRGKTLTENTFEDLYCVRRERVDIIPAKKNGKWGLINTAGKQLTGCKYEACERFNEEVGLCLVTFKDKKGYIDAGGTEYFED